MGFRMFEHIPLLQLTKECCHTQHPTSSHSSRSTETQHTKFEHRLVLSVLNGLSLLSKYYYLTDADSHFANNQTEMAGRDSSQGWNVFFAMFLSRWWFQIFLLPPIGEDLI